MDIEAYRVAVKLSVTENISASLLAISRKFGDTNKQAELFQRKMEQIGKMTLVGGAFTAAGLVITKGLDATIKAANDLVKAQNDFKTLNLSVQDNALVNSTAIKISHDVLGSTIAGNIRLIQDLHTAFGDLNHAIAVAPEFTKYESTVRMALGNRAASGTVLAAAKALEHRGGKVTNDHEEFDRELRMISGVQLGSRGVVGPKDYLAASKTGKIGYTLLNDKYLYGAFAGLMTMQGGDRSGTMLSTAFSSLIGGHMDKKAKGFLTGLGLYEEGVSKARMTAIRSVMKGMSPQEKSIYMQSLGGESLLSGGLKGQYSDIFTRNPYEFSLILEKKIRERYGANLTDEQVAKIIQANFNKNTGDFLGQNVLNQVKFFKDAQVFQHAMDYEKAYNVYLNSPDGAVSALSSAWTNLKAVMGLQLLPTVTNVTLGFARFIEKVGKFAEDNPWATKIAMYSATAVAGMSLVSGGIMLLGATITAARLVGSLGVMGSMATLLGGPVVWAIAAAAGAGYLLYKNWDKVKPAAEQMGTEFSGIMHTIWERAKEVGNYIANWSIWNSFNSFADKMETGFNSLFNTIISYLNKLPGVNLLTSQELSVKKNAFSLLDSINSITGGPKAPKALTGYAAAYAQQGESGGSVDIAAGLKGMYENRTTPSVPGRNNQTIQVNSTIHMDGKPVAQMVTKHQTREATKPPAGASAHDSSMGMVFPGQVSKLSTP